MMERKEEAEATSFCVPRLSLAPVSTTHTHMANVAGRMVEAYFLSAPVLQ